MERPKCVGIYVEDFYKNNRLFDMQDKISNRDNCLYPYFSLQQHLHRQGIKLSTYDVWESQGIKMDLIIFNDIPKKINIIKKYRNLGIPCFALLFESELIKPQNWSLKYQQLFSKIFTWNDEVVDNKKFFKINFVQDLSANKNAIWPSFKDREKFSLIIAGNKSACHKKELYSSRRQIIRWFEKNQPNNFDLYGVGWDKIHFGVKLLKPLNRLKIPNLKPFSSYKGKVSSKHELLLKYKFNICLENAKDIPGYITEKIFDSFLAGCVPVYYGPKNIEEHIPKNCFIDYREIKSPDRLYSYLQKMQAEEYAQYQHNIRNFLNSPRSDSYDINYFVKCISKEI